MSSRRRAAGLWAAVFGLVLCLAGCGPPGEDVLRVHVAGDEALLSYDVAHGGDRFLVAQAVERGDRADVIYFETDVSGRLLQARREVTSLPRDVFRSSLGNDLQVAGSGARRVVVWQVRGEGFRGRGPMRVAVSADGGERWQLSDAPFGSTHGDQGFFDLIVGSEGRFELVWLERGTERGKSLVYATSANGLDWTAKEMVDEVTCECCRNRLVRAPSGNSFVLYRDMDPRDMRLALRVPGEGWSQRGPAGAFDWHFDGCPHQGGGLSVTGGSGMGEEILHAAVWTGAQGRSGSYYLRSEDRGASWTEALPLGDAGARQIDLGADQAGRLALVWRELAGELGRILYVESGDGGESWSTARVLREAKAASHPRVLPGPGGGFQIFWAEQQQGRRTLVGPLSGS